MKLLVQNAQLQCTEGDKQSSLAVPSANISFVGDAPVATVLDFTPLTNIKPFGKCKSLRNPQVAAANGAPQPCVPATLPPPGTSSPWSKASSELDIDGHAALTENSTCACQWGGTIRSVSPGQELVEIVPLDPLNTREIASAFDDAAGRKRSDTGRKPDRREDIASKDAPLVFRYAVEVGPGHQWTDQATITLSSEDGSETRHSSLSSGTPVGSMRIIEFAGITPGVRYRGEISEGGMRIALFGFTSLHGLASESSPENLLEQLSGHPAVPFDKNGGSGAT